MTTYVRLTEYVVGYKESRGLLPAIGSLQMMFSPYKMNGVARIDVGAFDGVALPVCEKHQSYQGNVKPFHK